MNQPMTFSKSELFTAYNKARAELRRAGDVKGIERLNKALGILQSKAYYLGERAEYQPAPETCGCKDWEYHNAKNRKYTGPCKHMLAEALLVAMVERRSEYEITALVQAHEATYLFETSYRI